MMHVESHARDHFEDVCQQRNYPLSYLSFSHLDKVLTSQSNCRYVNHTSGGQDIPFAIVFLLLPRGR